MIQRCNMFKNLNQVIWICSDFSDNIFSLYPALPEVRTINVRLWVLLLQRDLCFHPLTKDFPSLRKGCKSCWQDQGKLAPSALWVLWILLWEHGWASSCGVHEDATMARWRIAGILTAGQSMGSWWGLAVCLIMELMEQSFFLETEQPLSPPDTHVASIYRTTWLNMHLMGDLGSSYI